MAVAEKVKRIPNESQRDCLENITGKYLVLAGPGTGKTFTIIERIKNMLNQGIKPEKILCITFTDAAANVMKRQIEKEHLERGIDISEPQHDPLCSAVDRVNQTEGQVFHERMKLEHLVIFSMNY